MKTIYRHLMIRLTAARVFWLALMLMGFGLPQAQGQDGVQFSIRLLPDGITYRVSMKPTVTLPTGYQQTTNSIQVTILAAPNALSLTAASISGKNGTFWNLQTVKNPVVPVTVGSSTTMLSGSDYFIVGLTNNGVDLPYTAGQETVLFEFTNGLSCTGPLSLWETTDRYTPKPPSQPINVGNDLTVFGIGFALDNVWLGNYNLGQATCSTPPGLSISSPLTGAIVASANPPISGTATAGSSVTVSAPGGQSCVTTADGSGNWSCTSLTFVNGPTSVTAVAGLGGLLSPAVVSTFTVNACTSPSIGGTAAYTGGTPCSSTNAGTINLTGNTGAVVKWQTSADGGTTWTDLANSSTKIYYSFINAVNGQQYRAVVSNGSDCLDANSSPVTITTSAGSCTTTSCDNTAGQIAITIPNSVTGASFTKQVIATDANGIIQYVSAVNSTTLTGIAAGTYYVYRVTFDNSMLPLPTLSTGTSLSAIGGACVAFSNQLVYNVCALVIPTIAITGPVDGTTVASLNPPISGTATPGSSVTVSGPNGQTCVAIAATPSGTWTCSSLTFVNGPTSVTAVPSLSGVTGTPVVNSFTVAVPPTVAILSPANNSTATTTPTISGTATPNAVVTLTGGPGSVGGPVSVTASPTGTYSTTAITFPAGPNSVTAVATDAGGTSSPAVDNFTVVAPPSLTVATPPTGGTTQPITGTATPGSPIVITGPGNTTLCTTTASVSGTFSCPVTVPVGPSTLTVTASGPGGSTSVPVSVSAIGPPTVAILSPVNNSTVATSPTISGTATPLSSVTVTAPGNPPVVVTADVFGNWVAPPGSLTFANGPNSVTAVASNVGGTSSPAVDNFTLNTCPTPTIAGAASFTGGPVCVVANAGPITLTGQVGTVVRWETSTDSGATWTTAPGSSTATVYNFANALNNQQYRAVLSNGASCANANSAAVTITTSPTVCTADCVVLPSVITK